MKTTPRMSLALAVLALALAACSSTQEKTCAADQTLCDGTCRALQTDAQHCGACGTACGAGEACQAAACTQCAASCPGGQCVTGVCVAPVYAACFNLDQVRGAGSDLGSSGAPLPTDDGPIAIAPVGSALYVANSLSNSVSKVTFGPPVAAANGAASLKVFGETGSFGPDLEFIGAHDGLLYVSNASVSTLVVADPARNQVVDEIPLPAGSNPQGIAFVGQKAYLALASSNEVAVIDVSREATCQPPDPNAPACGTGGTCAAGLTCVNNRCQRSFCGSVTKRIDLSALGFGTAEESPARLVAAGDRVYVSLNDLFTFTPSFGTVPGAHGKLAVIDAASDALVGTEAIDLGADCLNATGLALAGSTLWVTCGFFDQFATGAVSGAGFVPVDLSTATPTVGAIVATDHTASSAALCGGKVYAGSSDSGTLLQLDPATRHVSSALLCPPDPGKLSAIPAVACAPQP
jgi:hypothetical protein